jgi:hypothetical protein
MARKNIRKKTRRLQFDLLTSSVQRQPGFNDGQTTVILDDRDEDDRYVHLILSDDEAVRLAAKIAHHVGYTLVEA